MSKFEDYITLELRKTTAQIQMPEALLEKLVQKFAYSEFEESCSWSRDFNPPEPTWRDSFGLFSWSLYSFLV